MPIKVMGFCPGVRTRHVNGWVSIIWFASAVSVSVSENVKLQAVPQVVRRCGENVTLTCEATSSQKLEIKTFSWLFNRKACHYRKLHPELLCESTDKPPQHSLNLTLLNVMPVDQGAYLCKLRSNLGIKSTNTTVTVQDCLEHCVSTIDEARAKCCFNGVYPSGSIHWSQEAVNLTDSASTQVEADQHGRYNICSTLDVQRRNNSQAYKCSLWIPSARKYLSSEQLPVVRALHLSGSVSELQGILMVVEIMMVTFLT